MKIGILLMICLMAHPVHAKVINPKRDPFDMIVSAKSLVASSPKIQRSINKDVIESVLGPSESFDGERMPELWLLFIPLERPGCDTRTSSIA